MKKHIRKKKAQASVETILILSLITIFLLYIIDVDENILTGVEGDYTAKKMMFTLDSLIQTSNLVYQQGAGAKEKIRLSIPAHVESIELNSTVISVKLNISGEENDLYRKSSYPIMGSIPTQMGEYWFLVESHEGYVNITQWNGTWD